MGTQISCDKGHYYDSSYGKCPTCSGSGSTVLEDIGNSGDKSHQIKKNNQTEVFNLKGNEKPVKKQTSQTVYMRPDKTQIDEEVIQHRAKEVILAGWVVITSDIGKGDSFPVTFGFNSIGRGDSNHISLREDSSISREKHTSIIYDYSNNIYFIKHEDGKFLTYLNGELALDTKELKAFDTIKVGNTELLFVPLCGEQFKWDI